VFDDFLVVATMCWVVVVADCPNYFVVGIDV